MEQGVGNVLGKEGRANSIRLKMLISTSMLQQQTRHSYYHSLMNVNNRGQRQFYSGAHRSGLTVSSATNDDVLMASTIAGQSSLKLSF